MFAIHALLRRWESEVICENDALCVTVHLPSEAKCQRKQTIPHTNIAALNPKVVGRPFSDKDLRTAVVLQHLVSTTDRDVGFYLAEWISISMNLFCFYVVWNKGANLTLACCVCVCVCGTVQCGAVRFCTMRINQLPAHT